MYLTSEPSPRSSITSVGEFVPGCDGDTSGLGDGEILMPLTMSGGVDDCYVFDHDSDSKGVTVTAPRAVTGHVFFLRDFKIL